MGVGKYNLPGGQYFDVPDFSAPTSGWNGQAPAGLSNNPFGQDMINWNMALKYGKEREAQNQDILKLFNQGAQQGYYQGNTPAMYETDPTKLFQFFNSGQNGSNQGILTTKGILPYTAQQGVDPLQVMLYGGQYGITPNASASPASGAANPVNGLAAFNTIGGANNMGPYASGLEAFTAGLTPQQRAQGALMGPFQQSAPTGGVPTNGVPTAGLPTPQAQAYSPTGNTPTSGYGVTNTGSGGFDIGKLLGPLFSNGGNTSFSSSNYNTTPINIPNLSPVPGLPAPSQYQPTGQDTFLNNLGNYFQNFAEFAQKPQQANLNTDALSWLGDVIKQGGNPIDQTKAWNDAVLAQERNVQRNAGNLNEYFNTMGGRFSTAFGDAMGDYYSQTTKDQNALLSAAQAQALEAAQARVQNAGQLRAGFDIQSQTDALQRQAQLMGQLGDMSLQGPMLQAQLGNQRFLQGQGLQSQQNMQTQSLQSQQDNLLAQLRAQAGLAAQGHTVEQNMQGRQLQQALLQQQLQNQNALEMQGNTFGFNASLYNAQAADQAANQLAQNSVLGAQNLLNNSTLGAQLLFGNSTNAANSLFNNQNAGLSQFLQQYLSGQGLNNNTAAQLQQLLGQGVNQGLTLSGFENQQNNTNYQTLQQQIDRQYQEWLRTQPQYNPLLQMLAGLSGQQSNMFFPQFQPSMFQQVMGGLGGGGGLASILKLFGLGG